MKRIFGVRGRRHAPRNSRMPNYFYDLPEELQDLIHRMVHKQNVKSVHHQLWRQELYRHGAKIKYRALFQSCPDDDVFRNENAVFREYLEGSITIMGEKPVYSREWIQRTLDVCLFKTQARALDRLGGLGTRCPYNFHVLPNMGHTKAQLMWSCDQNGLQYSKSWKKERLLRLLLSV